MRRTLAALAVLAVGGSAPAAHAQMLVYDPDAVAKLIAQYETAVKQLGELQTQVRQGGTLLDSLNNGSAINTVAAQLSSPALRAFLPDAQAMISAARGDMASLGALGAAAKAVRSGLRLYTPAKDDAVGQDLEASGDRAAIGVALGRQVADVSVQRLGGLQTLQDQIGKGSAREALDLQARLQAEQALLVNEQIRLQGLAMAQAAQDRLQAQRERERAVQNQDEALQLFRGMRQ